MPRIGVLIADDHSFVREGARQLIDAQSDLEVVAEVENGSDVIQKARELRPDVVVLDITMPGLNGLDLIVLLRRVSPISRVVVLSFHQELMMVRRALSCGARGYVVKTAPVAELLDAIRAVSTGQSYLSSHIDTANLESLELTAQDDEQSQPYDLLTDREQQVFRLVVQGRTNQQIGDVLCISPRTVEKHRAAVLHKLGVKDTVGLMRCAVKLGVILADD